jgi:hypothetical protein
MRIFILHIFNKNNNIKAMNVFRTLITVMVFLALISLSACIFSSKRGVYHNENFDFASVRVVAVLPFENLTKDNQAATRVRDVFMNTLLSTGAMYVLPAGEVARGVSRAGIERATIVSTEEAIKLAGILKADAIITGVVREYGEVRSGTASSSIISLSLQMIEAQTGTVVWTAFSTRGGITAKDRLLGGGGQPMIDVTRDAVVDVINKLF